MATQPNTTLPPCYEYYGEYSLLLCSGCCTALAKDKAIEHLEQHYTQYEIEQGEYKETVKALHLATFQAICDEIRQREPVPKFNSLPTPETGYQCPVNGCTKLGCNTSSIQNHVWSHHRIRQLNRERNSMEGFPVQSLNSQHYIFKVQVPSEVNTSGGLLPRAEPTTPIEPSPSEPQLRNFRERFFSQRNALRGDQSVSYDGLRHQVSPLHQRT